MNKVREIEDNLKRIAKEGRIATTYLLSGGTRAERRAIAEHAAEEMVTSKADILFPEHEKENLFSVSDVRAAIVETLFIKPYGGGKKVYIIEDADLLNEQAQNALLKSLEEPPGYVVFFLLSENGNGFLATVMSRAVKITLPRKATNVEESEKENLTREKNLLQKGVKISPEDLAEYVSYVKKEKPDTDLVFQFVREWYRDVFLMKMTGKCSGFEELLKREQAKQYSYEDLTRLQALVDTAEKRIAANGNAEFCLLALFEGIKIL